MTRRDHTLAAALCVSLVAHVALLMVLIGRAMGRALAHELGHYLLASKTHTAGGLMQGRRRAYDFFAPEAVHFEINMTQRSQIVARLHKEQLVAS